MGELGLNKIFGALLAVALAVMGLREVSAMVFGGGHHSSHEYASLNEWAESNFHGYRIDIAEASTGGTVIEEIYDLGALMLAADIAKGERSFKGKCASCHTIEQGGGQGTGPNLYAMINAEKEHIAGFGYSGALSNTEGTTWTYENLDAWLEAPSKYARGTNMAFAGLSRDDERANVLAYLASYTPDAAPFPEPLPAAEETVTEEGEAVEGEVSAAEETAETIEAVVEETAAKATEAASEASETVTDIIDDAAEAVEDAVETVDEN